MRKPSSEKTSPSATLSTTNLRRTELGSDPAHCCERPDNLKTKYNVVYI